MDYSVRVGVSNRSSDDGGRKIKGSRDESVGPVLRIGVFQHGSLLKEISVRLRDLSMHLVTLGESGFGKTKLIVSLLTQVWSVAPFLPWLIFDLKGEYLRQLPHINDLVVLKPGLKKKEVYTDAELGDDSGENYWVTFMPLRVDLLHVSGAAAQNRNSVVTRVFTLLKESLASSFRESSELSPLMEKILLESLENAYSAYHGGRGFLDLLLREVERYADSEGRSRGRSDVVRSSEALANRIERFRRGYLEDVLNGGEGTLTSELISRRKVIVDLSDCVAQGTTEDLRLLLNILVEKVFEVASRRGLVKGHGVRHITVLEEANLLVPEVFNRKTSGDITPVEEMFLIARGYGEGFILAAQRPTISSFILSNAGTKVIFRSPYDAKRIGEILGMNEIAQNGIKSLQKFEAITATIEGDIAKVVTPKPGSRGQMQLVPVVATEPLKTEKPGQAQTSLRGPQLLAQSQSSTWAQPPRSEMSHPADQSAGNGRNDLAADCSANGLGQRGEGAGSLSVGEEDLSRLLKKGLSSNKFRLFKAIAVSPQLSISMSDAIRSIFGGKKWKYLDAVRSLANQTYWKNPPLALEKGGEDLRLTAYGAALWKLVYPLLVAVKREQWANM